MNGREVLATHAPVARPGLGWLVFVELPGEEANTPVQWRASGTIWLPSRRGGQMSTHLPFAARAQQPG